jgi:hypothetical protein
MLIVMHVDLVAFDEVHRVVVCVAAHEHEEIIDPVGDAEAQHLAVELDHRLRLRHEEGDMSDLEHAGAHHLLLVADMTPFAEQLDAGAFGILERQHLGQARNGVVTLFRRNSVLLQFAADVGEVRGGRHLECEL